MKSYMIKGACLGIMFQVIVAAVSVWTDQPYAAYAGMVAVGIGAVLGSLMGAVAYGDDH